MELAFNSFKVDIPAPMAPREREEVQELLPELALTVLEVRRLRREDNLRQLVEVLVGDVPLKPVDMRLARLQAQAHRAIHEGTEWLTAQQLAELANLGPGNPVASVNRWKQTGKVFAIRRDGKDFFPRYAFGPDFRPLPAMAKVMTELVGYKAEQMAAWFESTSGFLGGARPRELLASDPDRVIAAARDAVDSVEYAG